jgi:hypothetical protein
MEDTIKITSNKKVEIAMKPKRKHLELASYRLPKKKGETRDYVYGWTKVNKLTDIWTFIGYLVDKAPNQITFTYLQCNEWYYTFKDWKEKVKENKNVVARYEMGGYKYEVVLEYVAR